MQGRLDADAQLVVPLATTVAVKLVLCDLARARFGPEITPMRACRAISSRISLISLKVCASDALGQAHQQLKSVNAA